jgi:hypothetical protein
MRKGVKMSESIHAIVKDLIDSIDTHDDYVQAIKSWNKGMKEKGCERMKNVHMDREFSVLIRGKATRVMLVRKGSKNIVVEDAKGLRWRISPMAILDEEKLRAARAMIRCYEEAHGPIPRNTPATNRPGAAYRYSSLV